MFRYSQAAILAAGLAFYAPAAQAGLQQFADGLAETMAWNQTNTGGTFGFSGTSNQLAFLINGLGTFTVDESITAAGGGSTIATSALTYDGLKHGLQTFDFTLLQAATIAYTFATPTLIDGVLVSNLLTINIAAGSDFTFGIGTSGGQQTVSAQWVYNTSAGPNAVHFTSDLLSFAPGAGEGLGFSFSSGDYVLNGTNPTQVTFGGSSNYSSNPLPQIVPEPLSVALLLVGMTAVGVASRRRAARTA